MSGNERAALGTRLIRRLLAAPDAALSKVIGAPPIVRDGRALNRHVQAIISVGDRLKLTNDIEDVAQRRKQMDDASGLGMPKRTGIHVVDRRIPGPAGEIPVRIYRKFGSGRQPAAIMYTHGGGCT